MKEAIYAMSNTVWSHSKEAFRDGEFTETEGKGHQGLEKERMGKYCLLNVDSVLQDSHLSGDTVAECLPSAYKGLDLLSNTAENKGTSWHAGTCNPG